MVLDVDRFSKCLFAYLYKHYKNAPSSELSAGLPSPSNFIMPEDFIQSIGECQTLVNKILRPYFKTVFDKASSWACRSERTFLDFVKRRCLKLHIDHTPLLFLTICAVVWELNLYCFQRDCFRFAGYSAICLADVLRSSDDIMESMISDSDAFAAFGDKQIDGLKVLKEYCETILEETYRNPGFVPPVIEEVGKKFKKAKDRAIDDKVLKAARTMSVLEESVLEEFEEDDKDPLLGASRSSTPDCCKFCREKDCSTYLKEFEANYYLTFFS